MLTVVKITIGFDWIALLKTTKATEADRAGPPTPKGSFNGVPLPNVLACPLASQLKNHRIRMNLKSMCISWETPKVKVVHCGGLKKSFFT